MDHYLEIRLLPDPEFPPTILMNALFAKLHRVLAQTENHRIGVSFPGVREKPASLGERIRLHGAASDLEQLVAMQWLAGMRDYTVSSGVTPVPSGATYRVVRRVQAKSGIERLVRRRVKRGIHEEVARNALLCSTPERLDLPFISLSSQSTGQHFRLFIKHKQSESCAGSFSYYGLSASATVPWF